MALTSSELAQARTDLAATLPDSCVINNVTQTEGDMGGGSESLSPVATVACRIGPLSAQERIIAGAVAEDASYVVTLPALTTVTPQQVITSGGREFRITGIRVRSEELVRRVYVDERLT
jgi:head-tail adaptor